ncbi:WD repeat-containing protein 36, variant 6 [Dermatophagoides farinae]|uniref:WD repeat-containing protein 36, variant 6 n=1 Tax=Dermatophagoides farinae TaxID=6954 RepID=A0A922HQD1_DERFA|nr:WD repeat-containing protein 36, variant 6 [Dermatophagoides farinae]
MCCNQTSMNANIPPSSYHQAAATAASPQQIPISIPNSQSFDAATNEIRDDSHTFNLYIKFWNKETNRFKIIFVQSYYGLRSKIGSEINEDRLVRSSCNHDTSWRTNPIFDDFQIVHYI